MRQAHINRGATKLKLTFGLGGELAKAAVAILSCDLFIQPFLGLFCVPVLADSMRPEYWQREHAPGAGCAKPPVETSRVWQTVKSH